MKFHARTKVRFYVDHGGNIEFPGNEESDEQANDRKLTLREACSYVLRWSVKERDGKGAY